jgi:hypothetical protein
MPSLQDGRRGGTVGVRGSPGLQNLAFGDRGRESNWRRRIETDSSQVWPAPEDAEGEEMKLPRLLITDVPAFHSPEEYSSREVRAALSFHPRSPKARDPGLPATTKVTPFQNLTFTTGCQGLKP